MPKRKSNGRPARARSAAIPAPDPAAALRLLPIALQLHPGSAPALWRAAGGQPTCTGCSAHCCRYVAVEIDKPAAKWQFDQIRWMLLHENLAVFVEFSGRWYVEFKSKCRELSDENRCSIYESRPELCRDYEIETCPVWAEGEAHKWRWETAEAFENFMDARGVNWRYQHHPLPAGADPGGRTGVHSERLILRKPRPRR